MVKKMKSEPIKIGSTEKSLFISKLDIFAVVGIVVVVVVVVNRGDKLELAQVQKIFFSRICDGLAFGFRSPQS